MSRICELTGKKAMVGNNVSKSLNRTKRRFDVNLIKKRFFIPDENKWITLKNLDTFVLCMSCENLVTTILDFI